MREPEALREAREALRRGAGIRRELPDGGRLHLDRPLPYLCVYRVPTDRPDPGTAGLITTQASYLTAPAGEGATILARGLLEELARSFGEALLLEVWSAPGETGGDGASDSPRPGFRVAATAPELDAMRRRLVADLEEIRFEEAPWIEPRVLGADRPAPPDLQPLAGADGPESTHALGLEVAPVYRDRRTGDLYPSRLLLLRERLSAALKRALFVFSRPRTEVAHWLALGPSRLEETAEAVDRRLDEIDRSLDFLLQVTPVNAFEAWDAFRARDGEGPPPFRYRPLRMDTELLKRRLFDVPIELVEDPTVMRLLRAKQEELDRKIGMLRDRGGRRFFYGGLQLYGGVEPELLAAARDLLDRLPAEGGPAAAPPVGADAGSTAAAPALDEEAFARVAREELLAYREALPDLPVEPEVREDLPPGLVVSRGRLLIGRGTRLPADRVRAMLHHEIGTHVLTYHNGAAQPLRMLRTGMPGYEALQEGLAVLSEHLAGGLTSGRLRTLAARVVTVDALIEGASFTDAFRLLVRGHGFGHESAFTMAMRVFRSGGFSKDAIYLRGLRALLVHLSGGRSLEPLFVGKLSLDGLDAVEELGHRGILRPAPLRPRVLDEPGAATRLERLRGGVPLAELVRSPSSDGEAAGAVAAASGRPEGGA